MIRAIKLMNEWERLIDIQVFATEAGQNISRHQLERWRGMGLLPKVKQVGRGRAAGSEIHYPIGTSRQAVAIAKLFKINRKSGLVGWQLWLQGYDVDERYWLPLIEVATDQLRRVQKGARYLDKLGDRADSTIFDNITLAFFRGTPIAGSLKRVQPEIRPFIFGMLKEIIIGEFQAFSHTGDETEEATHQRAVLSAIGISSGRKALKVAENIGFEAGIEEQLLHISKAFEEIRSNPASRIKCFSQEVRKEFTAAMQLLENLHAILKVLKMSPFGTGNAILRQQKVQAVMIVIWAIFRQFGTIKSIDYILQMANSVRAIRMQSQ